MGRNTRRLLTAALVILGAGAAGAQSTPTMATTSTATGTTSPAAATTSPVEQIVALARTVEPGAASVTAFTVPAGRQLVVTDVLITNPSTTPVCGAAISPSGAATSALTTGATTPANAIADTGTITSTAPTTVTTPGGSTVTTPTTTTTTTTSAASESGTGMLCIPAQTSLTLSLTTGLEFAGGQSVMLANPVATTATSTAAGAATTSNAPLFYHLRGFLVAPGV